MEESALLNYNAFDGFIRSPNVDEIVRIVLDEQKHSLSEADRRILRDHENLRNEFHTLQNVILTNSNESPSKYADPDESSWCDLTQAESSTAPKSDVYFVDVEAIEQPSLATENVEPVNIELDNAIANFIQDENVKSEVLRLNQHIRLNASNIRSLQEDAKKLMMEKLNLKRKLAHIQRKISNFSAEELRVRRIRRKKGTDSADTGHQKRTYFYRFGAPYFKSKDRFPVDRNPDLLEIVRTNQPMNIHLPRSRRILSHDAAFLEKSILKQLKAKRVEQLRKCLKDAENRHKADTKNSTLQTEIRCIVQMIKETEQITRVSETKEWNIPVDFLALDESPRFSSDDYERIWRLMGSPTLTRGEFSEQEVAELKSLAKKYKEQDWDRIASEMSTSRSGFMCFTKYVTVQKKGKNQPWTKEENELLHKLCISMDSVSKSDSRFQFWKNIRYHFPHRSYTQIHSHWTYVLEPSLKKGRFTPEESKLMKKMLNDGKSYKEIATTLQNRSVVQVRTHFEVLLQKEITRGNWTAEEEDRLLQLIEKYGTHDWVTISKELGTRNRSQCRLKYAVYQKNNQRFSVGNRAPKEFWTEEENELFKDLLAKYGSNFTKMSEEMPTKTREQLRHKYHRSKHKAEFHDIEAVVHSDRQKRSKILWTDEEMKQFKQLLVEHGTQYRRIAKLMPTKNAIQLRYKYSTMKYEWNLQLPSNARPGSQAKVCGGNVESAPLPVTPSSSLSPPPDHSMKNEWNSLLPMDGESIGQVEDSDENLELPCYTSISAPCAPVPVTYVTEPPKTLLLPPELFENLAPVADVSPASPQTLVSPSDPLFVSSNEKKECKSSETSLKYWNPMEVEHFKRLLMVYGPDYKKISSILQHKTPKQLRWKFYSHKEKWNLPLPPVAAPKVEPKKCKTPAVPDGGERKKSCKTKRKQPAPQQGVEISWDHVSAIISEVAAASSTPADIGSDVVPVEPESTVCESEKPVQPKPEKPAPKSSCPKATWTDEELEKFKGLIMEVGPQYKKLSEIMVGKTIPQLRYKYYSLRNAGVIPSFEKPDGGAKPRPAKRAKLSAPVSGPKVSAEQPLPVELFETSNLSMFIDSEDGFAGFPDESPKSPASFRDLIPRPGSSCEQMIVPESIAEMDRRIDFSAVDRNECPSAADLNESVVSISQTQLNVESVSDTVEVKREIDGNEIKEEDERDEFSV